MFGYYRMDIQKRMATTHIKYEHWNTFVVCLIFLAFNNMVMSGHKTDSAFRRYYLVTEEEISRGKWYEEEKIVDTYMDTNSTVKN